MPPEGISSHSISKILLINIFNYIIISTTSYRLTSHETQTSTVLAQLWRFSSFKSVNYNPILWNDSSIWVWVNTYRYIFSGLFTSINPSYDLGFTRGTRVLTHPHYLLMVKGFNTSAPIAARFTSTKGGQECREGRKILPCARPGRKSVKSLMQKSPRNVTTLW